MTKITPEQRRSRRLACVQHHIAMENAHDLASVMATFGSEPRYDDQPSDEHHEGRAEVQAYYSSLLRAVPDLNIDVRRTHVAQDAIVVECEISGTHRGLWRGLPATGRRVCFALCAVYTFTGDDELAAERIFYDRATVFRQLGVFREPETAAGRLATLLNHPVTVGRALLRR